MYAPSLTASAQLHNEVKRLKRKNNAYAKELSRTKERLQTDQSLIGRRGELYVYVHIRYHVCVFVYTYVCKYVHVQVYV